MRGIKLNLFNRDDDITNYIGNQNRLSPFREAIGIALSYGMFGFLWILLSDRVLDILIHDKIVYRQIQTYKGWIYVCITTIFIYYIVRTRIGLINNAINSTVKAYEELSGAHEELISIEDELRYQKTFVENIIKDAPVVISTYDTKGKIKSVNPFGAKLFGYEKNEYCNQNLLELLIPKENRHQMLDIFDRIKKEGQLKNHEGQFVAKDGKFLDILWNSSVLSNNGNQNEIVSIGTDISEKNEAERRLRQLAFYDSLTGLPNRSLFEKEINHLILNHKDQPFALMIMDMDNFKYINDTLNHQAGDDFLKYISQYLSLAIKSPNLVARLGGDEFGILIKEGTSKEFLLKIIDDFKNTIGKIWSIHNHNFFISFSIGVSQYPKNGNNPRDLFKRAEVAMYASKKEGKNRILFYNTNLKEENTGHIEMAKAIQYAIEREEFSLYFQPQYNINPQQLIGMEALIRWYHPKKGFISPAAFIPIAEETGQIYEIEKWVIKEALNYKKYLEEMGYSHLEISFNLSSKTLTSYNNFQELKKLIDQYSVELSSVVIEITETAIILDIDNTISRLLELKRKGFQIALDDFGTGYSSLTYLKSLPIDIIKMDRDFISRIEEDGKDKIIIKSLLCLARELGYGVVAEGIETHEQLDFLKENNCSRGQGYLLSKPVSKEVMSKMIMDTNS